MLRRALFAAVLTTACGESGTDDVTPPPDDAGMASDGGITDGGVTDGGATLRDGGESRDAGPPDGLLAIGVGAGNRVVAFRDDGVIVADAIGGDDGTVLLDVGADVVHVATLEERNPNQRHFHAVTDVRTGEVVDLERSLGYVPATLIFPDPDPGSLPLLVGDCVFGTLSRGTSPLSFEVVAECGEMSEHVALQTDVSGSLQYTRLETIVGDPIELRAGPWVTANATADVRMVSTSTDASFISVRFAARRGSGQIFPINQNGDVKTFRVPDEPVAGWLEVGQIREVGRFDGCRVRQRYTAGVPLTGGDVTTKLDAPVLETYTSTRSADGLEVAWTLSAAVGGIQQVQFRGPGADNSLSWTVKAPPDRRRLRLPDLGEGAHDIAAGGFVTFFVNAGAVSDAHPRPGIERRNSTASCPMP